MNIHFMNHGNYQGYNARKIISEVCASFVLQCTVSGRLFKHKPDMGSIFHIKNQLTTLVIGNYYVNYQNYQNLMLSTSSDTKRTLIHLFRPERTGYVRRLYATAINFPCIITLVFRS